MDPGLRPPGMEVILSMQEHFSVRRGDEEESLESFEGIDYSARLRTKVRSTMTI